MNNNTKLDAKRRQMREKWRDDNHDSETLMKRLVMRNPSATTDIVNEIARHQQPNPVLDALHEKEKILEAEFDAEVERIVAERVEKCLANEKRPLEDQLCQREYQIARLEKKAMRRAEHLVKKNAELKTLQECKEKLDRYTTCAGCYEERHLMVAIPCGHALFCVDCSAGMQRCYTCRQPVTGLNIVYCG